MTRWVSRDQYEAEQSAGQVGGFIGLIVALIGSIFWFVYQGVKRPLSFFIYLFILVILILPVSHFMKTTDNGILQIVLAFIMMGLIIGALIGSRGPILALERMEGHVMVWIYNRSHIAGMIVYWGLMIAVALLGGTLMRAVAMTLDQMFKWGLSAWMFYAGGAVLSVIFRMVYHPLSAQVDVFGRPKVENVVEAGMYESDIAPSDPENHETPQG